MTLRGIKSRVAGDPFLKIGIAAMVLALAFAGVVTFFAFLEGPQRAVAAKSSEESTSEPLVRSDPGVDPWVEKDLTQPQIAQTTASPQPEPTQPGPTRPERTRLEPPKPESRSGAAHDCQVLPVNEDGYPLPTQEQIQAANQPRQYHLPPGAIMSLTIPEIGLEGAPILNSDTRGALDRGVVHLPDTSLPWSQTPQTNVYLAGHRLGWPGTGSHLIFYRLDELDGGERITLGDRRGESYD